MTTAEKTRKDADPAKTDNRSKALQAARQLFVEEGYAAFSMRKVARAIGISQGHLQHFFPTREDLVNAMLEETADHYMSIYGTLLTGAEGSAIARFESVVTFLVEDITNREVMNFFFELWPLTAHNETASTMLHSIYRRTCDGFAKVVQDLDTTLTEDEAQDISLQILALIDGLIIYYHSAAPDADRFARVTHKAKQTIRQIAGLR